MPHDTTAAPEKLYRVPELTGPTGLCGEALYQRIRRGELRAVDVSRPGSKRAAYRVPASALAEFLAAKTVTPIADAKPIPRRRRAPSGKQYV